MSKHNTFSLKNRKISLKYPQIFEFLSYRNNFIGIKKQAGISPGKQAVDIRVIVFSLYSQTCLKQPPMGSLKSGC